MKNKLCIIDDDPQIVTILSRTVQEEGYEVITYSSPTHFFQHPPADGFAAAIVDVYFGPMEIDGEEFMKKCAQKYPSVQFIMISGESTIAKALSCIKAGAIDFMEKPLSLPRLLTSVRNASTLFQARATALARCEMLGQSQPMKDLNSRIQKIAPLEENVLITGENGTGKELVANNLHFLSKRHAHSLYKVNCASLHENLLESELFGHKAGSFTGANRDRQGFFEAAAGSSLLLDEIGDMHVRLQAKLLRVLQEKHLIPVGSTQEIPVDVRLIFATHADLEELLRHNLFRQDLLYRISTFTIRVPPLRERPEDIEMIASHFIRLFCAENNLKQKYLSEKAIHKLKTYSFPGNVRELCKIVKNAALFSQTETIEPSDIDFCTTSDHDIWRVTQAMNLSDAKTYFEQQLVTKRLALLNNNLKSTAESLGIVSNNLYRILRRLNVSKGMKSPM